MRWKFSKNKFHGSEGLKINGFIIFKDKENLEDREGLRNGEEEPCPGKGQEEGIQR